MLNCSSSRVAHRKGTQNGQKRVEAEQSSYYREYPVAFGQKREIVGVGQSDTANNTLCRYCFQVHPSLAKKAPGTPVFGHCPFLSTSGAFLELFLFAKTMILLRKGGIHCNSGSSLDTFIFFEGTHWSNLRSMTTVLLIS